MQLQERTLALLWEAELFRQAGDKQANNHCEQSKKSPLHDDTADAENEQAEKVKLYENFVLVARIELAEALYARGAAQVDVYETQTEQEQVLNSHEEIVLLRTCLLKVVEATHQVCTIQDSDYTT